LCQNQKTKRQIFHFRMSKDGYYGDFESMAHEQSEYDKYAEQTQEPNVVPCYKCGGQMYEASDDPKENICDNCNKTN